MMVDTTWSCTGTTLPCSPVGRVRCPPLSTSESRPPPAGATDAAAAATAATASVDCPPPIIPSTDGSAACRWSSCMPRRSCWNASAVDTTTAGVSHPAAVPGLNGVWGALASTGAAADGAAGATGLAACSTGLNCGSGARMTGASDAMNPHARTTACGTPSASAWRARVHCTHPRRGAAA